MLGTCLADGEEDWPVRMAVRLRRWQASPARFSRTAFVGPILRAQRRRLCRCWLGSRSPANPALFLAGRPGTGEWGMGPPFDCELLGHTGPSSDREVYRSRDTDDGLAGTAKPKGAEGSQVAACSDAAL